MKAWRRSLLAPPNCALCPPCPPCYSGRVTEVCRRWRRIIYSEAPGLWQHLCLTTSWTSFTLWQAAGHLRNQLRVLTAVGSQVQSLTIEALSVSLAVGVYQSSVRRTVSLVNAVCCFTPRVICRTPAPVPTIAGMARRQRAADAVVQNHVKSSTPTPLPRTTRIATSSASVKTQLRAPPKSHRNGTPACRARHEPCSLHSAIACRRSAGKVALRACPPSGRAAGGGLHSRPQNADKNHQLAGTWVLIASEGSAGLGGGVRARRSHGPPPPRAPLCRPTARLQGGLVGFQLCNRTCGCKRPCMLDRPSTLPIPPAAE